MSENHILKTLQIRPFLYLILSEFFSQFSMNIFNFILLIVVFSIAKSNSAVSGVVIAFTFPTIIFGILAGVLVDRWNKKNVLFLTNFLRALMVVPLFFLSGDIFIIYAVTFGVSILTQFFIPAETPMIPVLVDRKYLLSANAIFGMVMYSSIFLAYALSGPILFLLGKQNVFIFITIFFLIATFFASIIKVKKKKEIGPTLNNETLTLSFSQEIKTLITLISKTKSLYHALFSLTLAQVLIYVLAVIGPGYAQGVLRIKVEDFPLFFVTPAVIGMTLGALILGSFLHKISRSYLTKIGLILLGIAILLMPYGAKLESREFVQFINFYLPLFLQINILHIMIVLAFIIGFATAFVFVPANTILQEETSDESRGKIYGLLNSLVGVISFIPVVAVGGLADVIGVKAVITGIGIIVLVIAAVRIFITDKN
ncbi:MAG: Major facilitator superfamily [Candidatus Levybacteria bacterium GW2011_GWB1_35_5]|nr:MAG: Major facilitator superfamily [Candidatus Levybacteria bacterium GW2011_GWB1_35_5]